jgi:hypothetical protein
MKSENGSLTIFIAFIILPIIFFLLTLSMDLSVYYTRSERAQKIVDEAVLYAHRFLPEQEQARNVANLYLQQNLESLGPMAADPVIDLTSDSVSILYHGSSGLTFAGLFSKDSPLSLPYNVFSSSRSTPLDIYLAVDTSSYLAPDLFNGSPWGALNEWPAANFFEHDYPLSVTNPKDGSEKKIDTRLATQQCFNEVLSAQKTAAIEVYDYLASFSLNSLGLGFYPTNAFTFDEAREIEKAGKRSDKEGEADINPYFGTPYQRNSFCAAAAERESQNIAYNFPKISSQLMANPLCPPGTASSITDATGKNINGDYQPCIQAKEAIWSRSVYDAAAQDFPSVFEFISLSLIAPKSRGTERGGLISSVPKIGIILSGDLPRLGAERFPKDTVYKALEQKFDKVAEEIELNKTNYTLYQVLFSHRGITDNAWDQNVAKYKEFLSKYNSKQFSNGSFKIKLFVADNPETVVSDIVSLILLEKRRVMISDKKV